MKNQTRAWKKIYKKFCPIALLAFYFFVPAVSAQNVTKAIYEIPVGVYTWNRSMPLKSFIDSCSLKTDQNIILIGYNDKAVFTAESSMYDSGKGFSGTTVVETDYSGQRTEFGYAEVFGYTEIQDIDSLADPVVIKPTYIIDFDSLKKAKLVMNTKSGVDWVGKTYIKSKNKSFTWKYFADESKSRHYPVYSFTVQMTEGKK